MSHIQGQPHPEGTAEHLDYVRIDVDTQGVISDIAVVTKHYIAGIFASQEVIVYRMNPGPSQRDLAAVLLATGRTALQRALTNLAGAAALADTPQDPAPPRPQPEA